MAKEKELDMGNIFDVIEEQRAEQEKSQSSVADPRILKFDKTKTVYLRMFVGMSDPKKPMADLIYKVFNWESLTTGKNIYGGIDTKQITGQPHFLETKRNELFNAGGQKERAIKLFPHEKALVNVYIIDDSAEEDNNGKYMVMRYGAKPQRAEAPNSGSPFIKFINSILNDEDNGITKNNLYSLGEDGITIKVEFTKGSDGNFPTYTYSFYQKPIKGFSGLGKKVGSPECVDAYKTKSVDLLGLIEEQIQKESENITEETLKVMFNQHILGVSTRDGSSVSNDLSSDSDLDLDEDEDDDIPMGDTKEKSKSKPKDDDDDLDLDFDLDDINLDD